MWSRRPSAWACPRSSPRPARPPVETGEDLLHVVDAAPEGPAPAPADLDHRGRPPPDGVDHHPQALPRGGVRKGQRRVDHMAHAPTRGLHVVAWHRLRRPNRGGQRWRRGRPERDQEARGAIPVWLRVPHRTLGTRYALRVTAGGAPSNSVSRLAGRRASRVGPVGPAGRPTRGRGSPPPTTSRVRRPEPYPVQVEDVDEQRELIVRRMEAFLQGAVGRRGRHGSGATGRAHEPATTPSVTGGAGGRTARYAHSRSLAVCNSASCTML